MTPTRLETPLTQFFDGPPILTPAKRLRDPSGLTTGRWTVKRVVLVMIGGVPAAWVWRAAPQAARGVDDSILRNYRRDFTTHEKALQYATDNARKNIR
jgi:hypothetical protein